MPDSPRKPYFFSLILAVIPIVFFVLLEVALRTFFPDGRDDLVVTTLINGKTIATLNNSFVHRYYPGAGLTVPRFSDAAFSDVKPPDEYRIVFIGESTITGSPYEYNGSLHRLLADRLTGVDPGRKIEVVNLGLPGITSAGALDLLNQSLSLRPDCVIVYTGNGECYPPIATFLKDYPALDCYISRIYLLLERSRTFRLLKSLVDPMVLKLHDTPGRDLSPAQKDLLAHGNYITRDGMLYRSISEHFSTNISAMAESANEHHLPLILCTIAGNVRDQAPFGSDFNPGIQASARSEWDSLFVEGSACLAGQLPDSALKVYRKAETIDSSRADLQYRIGAALLRLGRIGEGRTHLALARDLDQFRLRAGGDFNDSIRAIAARKNVMCADIEKLFERQSPDSMTGYPLMLEHIHPSIDGYFLIAKKLAVVMKEHNCLRPSQEWPLPLGDDDYKSASLMTLFDFETAVIRADSMVHRWPFNEPDSTRYKPETAEGELAQRYCGRVMTWPEAHYRIADWYKSNHRSEDAVREYLAVAKIFDYDPQPLILAGDATLSGGRMPVAEQFYRRAASLSPNPVAAGRLGDLFFTLGNTDSSLAWYLDALHLETNTVQQPRDWKIGILHRLAELFVRRQDLPSAQRVAQNILSLDPRDAGAIQILSTMKEEISPRMGK